MKNWYQNLIKKRPFLKFLGSKYTLVLLFFLSWILFFDESSYLDQRVLDKQINELEDNKQYYKNEIAKDKKKIKDLNQIGQIEKYAREQYFMKKDSEDIYIIENEKDKIKILILSESMQKQHN
jgi:cell division protein FtsB